MASTNYAGRTVDVLIFQGVKEGGDQAVDLTLGDSGSVCTGIQKVAQTFTSLFLTRLGSIAKHPTWGTNFITDFQQGKISRERYVKLGFDTASELVRRTMAAAIQGLTVPPDERLASTTLTGYNINSNTGDLTLTIKLNTAAGSSRTIFLPVSVAIK